MLSRRNRLLVLVGTAAACLFSQAALAELIVLRLAGPTVPRAYKVGARLPDNHRFVLRPGDTLTLRRSEGGVVVIRGPGAGTADILSRRPPPNHTNTPRSGH